MRSSINLIIKKAKAERKQNMSVFNISAPTTEQWKKVATALAFSFVSTFLASFIAMGGIQDTLQATLALAASAVVGAINAALYALYITVFKKAE